MNANVLTAKIAEHSRGLGTVTPQMLEERAREIAREEGRGPEQMHEGDLVQARRELSGREPGSDEADRANELNAEAAKTAAPAPQGVAGSSGHRAEGSSAHDEQQVAEELVREGREEAEHDRRQAAADRLEEED